MTTGLIDADVHPHALPHQLEPHLDERWRAHLERLGTRVAGALAIYPRVRNAGFRVDAWPDGGFPGSDLTLLQRQLLDEYGIDYAVLTPLQNQVYGGEAPEFGAALCRAVNGWIEADWLDPEPRLRGSISIAFEHADVSVARDRAPGRRRALGAGDDPRQRRAPARQPQVLADLRGRDGGRDAGRDPHRRHRHAPRPGLALLLPRGARLERQRDGRHRARA